MFALARAASDARGEWDMNEWAMDVELTEAQDFY